MNIKTQKNKRFTTIKNRRGYDWICICKNTALADGFYPCTSEGERVEPTEKEWTAGWYVCNRCGRIIDQKTLRVVGVRFNNTLTVKERKAIFAEISRWGFPKK